jgi:hypothetical protein
MRRVRQFSLLIAITVAVSAPAAKAQDIVTYTHGSVCQPHTPPATISYSDMGMFVNTPGNLQIICPMGFSEQTPSNNMQQLMVYLYWNSVPVAANVPAFNPTCRLYMTTVNGTDVSVGLNTTVNPGTNAPAFVFLMGPSTLPIEGSYASAAIMCTGVPAAVGINAIRADACFPGAGQTCPQPPPPDI